MDDYEVVYVSSIGSPYAGECCLTVSDAKVRFYPSVLEKLGNPKRIAVHRGVRSNEGKILIEAAENTPGTIMINYERKKICFYSGSIIDLFKEMIREYAHGEFVPGIFFTVKGFAVGENAVEFDFRDAVYRVVPRTQIPSRKKKTSVRNGSQISKTGTSGTMKTAAFSAATGFNMPNMAGRAG